MTDNDKNYILDPLTCLSKIALLYFMPEKSKLAIGHHVLYLQKYSWTQWIERKKNGDNRNDLSKLDIPITKAVMWYLVINPSKIDLDEEFEKTIKKITEFTIKGLLKLQQYTYQDDKAIKIILQYFINILRNALNGEWDDNICVIIEDNSSVLTDKIKENLESQTFNFIAKILSDCDNNECRDNIDTLIECAHKLLLNRDNNFVKMMKNINTIL